MTLEALEYEQAKAEYALSLYRRHHATSTAAAFVWNNPVGIGWKPWRNKSLTGWM
jgi:hypothetical protein